MQYGAELFKETIIAGGIKMTLKEKVAEIQPDCIDDNYEADGVKR